MKTPQNKTTRITKNQQIAIEADKRRAEIKGNIPSNPPFVAFSHNYLLVKSTDNKTKQVAAVDFTTNPIWYEFKSLVRKFFASIILAATIILTACETKIFCKLQTQ